MNTAVLLNLAVKVAILLALGYLVKKTGLLTAEMEKGISGLLVQVICPFSIIASGHNDYSSEMVANMGLMALIAFAYYVIAILIMRPVRERMKLNRNGKAVFLTLSVFCNAAFIGYPLFQELYGNEGFIYAVIYNFFFQVFFFTYGVSIISGMTQINWKKIILTPLNASLVIMLVLFLFQIKLPAPVQDTLQMVGNMMVPLSMMIIGASLVGMKPAQILKDRASYAVSFFRLIFFPLLTLIVMKLLGFSGKLLVIGVVMAGLPSGSMNVIFAKQYDCEADFAARAVVQTMLFCLVTIPLLLLLVGPQA